MKTKIALTIISMFVSSTAIADNLELNYQLIFGGTYKNTNFVGCKFVRNSDRPSDVFHALPDCAADLDGKKIRIGRKLVKINIPPNQLDKIFDLFIRLNADYYSGRPCR